MFNRRHILGMMAGGVAYGVCPKVSAQTLRNERKFIFVYAEGGWDPLAVFAPMYGSQYVDMEPGSEPVTVGDFHLVDHGNRSAVAAFFRRWKNQVAIINGVSTRSVGHEPCTVVSMTGDASASIPDWPTLLAQNSRYEYSLPSLVVAGPSFPGDLEEMVARVGDTGQLANLVREGMFSDDTEEHGMGRSVQSRIDRFLMRRIESQTAAELTPHRRQLHHSLLKSIQRSVELKALDDALPFAAETFEDQMRSAIGALSMGLSRCVTISDRSDWDTHEDNAEQAPFFQQLFTHLNRLMETLTQTAGPAGGTLMDETTVVVMSEMGRTPKYNQTGGRDHWPYTTAMLMGTGFAGGRQFGGYDQGFSGIGINASDGTLLTDKLGVSSADFGATLLAMADVDPHRHLPYAEVLTAVLGHV